MLDKIKTDYLSLWVGGALIYTVHGSEAGAFNCAAQVSVITGDEAYGFKEHPQ